MQIIPYFRNTTLIKLFKTQSNKKLLKILQCQKITYFNVAKNKFSTDTESNMAKVRIKSDKIVPLGGIFSIMERFKSSARSCASISAEARARRRSLTIYLKKTHSKILFCKSSIFNLSRSILSHGASREKDVRLMCYHNHPFKTMATPCSRWHNSTRTPNFFAICSAKCCAE